MLQVQNGTNSLKDRVFPPCSYFQVNNHCCRPQNGTASQILCELVQDMAASIVLTYLFQGLQIFIKCQSGPASLEEHGKVQAVAICIYFELIASVLDFRW